MKPTQGKKPKTMQMLGLLDHGEQQFKKPLNKPQKSEEPLPGNNNASKSKDRKSGRASTEK